MINKQDYGVLILAAGSSSRMGKSKQLLPIGPETLLSHTVKVALALNLIHNIVVLGSEEKRHQAVLSDHNIQVASNPAWNRGMGSSLKVGLKSILSAIPELTGIVILVCDQPYLTTDHLRKLIEKHQHGENFIVASRYKGISGVPVVFAKKYFTALLQLSDEQGAKIVIEKNPNDVALVDFEHGEIDLDTPEDYQIFLNQKNL
jgi:molybdenum cofactor cytidylyltransferase